MSAQAFTEHRIPNGTRVRKAFGSCGEYVGHVVGYKPRRGWYKVRYSDGDEEEMTRDEVVEHAEAEEEAADEDEEQGL